MRTSTAIPVFALLSIAAGNPDPVITPAPVAAPLIPRQISDPAFVGWVSTSGQQVFSQRRYCTYPETLTVSGSFAQCCGPTAACHFYTTCTNGNLVAAATSVFCDNGYCNAGVIVPSMGASGGNSFLGCWGTEIGRSAFSLVQNIGSAPIATATTRSSSSSESSSIGGSRSVARSTFSETTAATSSRAAPASSSPGVAAVVATPLTGVMGIVAGLLAML
ncbi:hypothetical protein B0J11DRAFT_89781 [Dendryphion nanum]|uniref:Uncharacterized protein n=1 Tax=Dendryphion nanum TaxID=256645 RepID=A0A9P9IDJ2_9PLEO|nr:hypothetical protein B0J11DRAFT_89781 [Dendryphion nanum]